MSKKDPAFLFYSKDWIEGTAEMMPEEKGVYIDLLAYQHQRGYLPSETKRLARLVRMSVDEFEKIWIHISDKFEQEGERTLNRKLEQVMSERSDKGETNKIIGIFGNLCRTSTRKRSDINKIRKQFKASSFKGIDSERLSERITEWFEERLAALEDEDANVDVDKNKIPTIIEVEGYFKENGYTIEAARKFFRYYETSRGESGKVWKDGAGNTVKNWKQKAQGVWFKPENKTNKSEDISDEDLVKLTYSEIRKIPNVETRKKYCNLKGIKEGNFNYRNIVKLENMAF